MADETFTCKIHENGEQCGKKYSSLRSLKRHYRQDHAGEVETLEEHLPNHDSEQRDFAGEEPSTEDHQPEHEVTNDPDGGEQVGMDEFS